MCVLFIPILVTTFPEWPSGTEPLPHTPGAVLVVFVVFCVHMQFCRFDKVDATADVQWHCNHRPPLWYHYFPAQSSLGADILVYWIEKIVRTCASGGSRTLDFLRARRAPYPLDQALRYRRCCVPILLTTYPTNLSSAIDWCCVPILLTTFPTNLSSAIDCCCVPILLTTFPPNLSGTYP